MNLPRPVGVGGEARDRNRRRIGGDDGSRFQQGADVVEDLPFDVLVLGNAFDDEIDVAKAREVTIRRDTLERGGALGCAEFAPLHQAPGEMAEQVHGLGQLLGIGVKQGHVEARDGAHLGDAATHLTGTDDADRLDHFASSASSSGTILNKSPTMP